MNEISSRLEKIRHDITAYSPYPDKVRLVAVSKRQPMEKIRIAVSAGAEALGENRIQDAVRKFDENSFSGVERHFIGYLQSNKVNKCIRYFHWLHSLQSVNCARKISGKESNLQCLVEVNISGEKSKSGLQPDELRSFLKTIREFRHCRVRGLMGMAAFNANTEVIRSSFAHLKELAEQNKDLESSHMSMNELSMGMTQDYIIALEEGATMIRIGTGLFGPRQN